MSDDTEAKGLTRLTAIIAPWVPILLTGAGLFWQQWTTTHDIKAELKASAQVQEMRTKSLQSSLKDVKERVDQLAGSATELAALKEKSAAAEKQVMDLRSDMRILRVDLSKMQDEVRALSRVRPRLSNQRRER